MAGGNVSAVPAPKGLELGFVDKGGAPIEEARYGLFDHAFGGTQLLDGPGDQGFISRDSRSFRLRVKTPLGGGKKQLKATWRTLWPMKPEEQAEADAGGPLDGKMIHQSELTLTLTKERGVYLSEPVMLVAGKLDLVPANVGWKDAVASEGQPDYRLLLAHLQGRVQLEHAWGKGKVVRRSIPVWRRVRTLWVQNLVCEPEEADKGKTEVFFDPRAGDDKEYFCIAMRSMQQIYACQGLYVNTWQPAGPGVHTVEDGGTAYSFKFAPVPPRKVAPIPQDPPAFPRAEEHKYDTDPLNIVEWDRNVRYPRAYPAWSPNAVRVFFGRQVVDTSAHGIATGDDAKYSREKLAERASLEPSRRSVFVLHQKGLADTSSDTMTAGGRKYGGGPQTTAHEVGHVLMPKGPESGGASAHASDVVHVMVAGATTGALARILAVNGTRRIFDESDYSWAEKLQKWPGLEG